MISPPEAALKNAAFQYERTGESAQQQTGDARCNTAESIS
jgi:hypothetical protein